MSDNAAIVLIMVLYLAALVVLVWIGSRPC